MRLAHRPSRLRGKVPRDNVAPLEQLESRRLLANAVTGVGTGLVGNYFADTQLNHLVLTRVDPTVNFQWGTGSPDPKVPSDFFSARWTGQVQAQYSESYTFYTESDEGVAVWVNGQQVIDDFDDHTLTEDSGTISLQAGEMYDIRIEYYETAFAATMQLLWSSPSTPKQIIPESQLYGNAGWTNGAFLNSDVGSPATAGSVNSAGTTFNLLGGGNGTGGSTGATSDQFQYLYQTLEGDGTIVAQVSGTQGSSGGADAGVMIRSSLDGNSPYAAVEVNASGAEQFESRLTTGAAASSGNSSGATGLYWLKLVRDGNFINGYSSPTGADNTWISLGSANVPMDQTAYIGLLSTGGTNLSLNHAQFKNITVIATPPLGAGLDQVRDYSEGNVFVDIAKQMRTFQGPNLGPTVGTDSNGWATADFMTIFLTGYTGNAHLYNGTYKLSFTGQADLDTWLTPGGQVLNKVYNAATNTTTADVVVNASDSADGWYFGMNFRNTQRTATSATNTGITNIKMIRPGYDPNTTQIFTNAYLAQLSQFSTLRFMDWTQTNNSTVVNWSDRTTLNSASQASTKGVAWEYVVDLANQLHKDIWINIPINATDDYVTQLAALLKNTLDPGLVVYVEYSNEVWNGIFTQYNDNLNAAIAEVAAGNSPLNADGETNQVYWAWRRVAERLKTISDIFGSVWGPGSINGRVRPVLAGQYANPLVVQEGLEFIERTYGAPSQFFYGVAQAPYFGFASLDNSSNSLTATQIINALQSSVNSKTYFGFDSLARRYGLANIAYEGGPDTSGPNNINAKIAASLDPRMEAMVISYLDGWYNTGGDLFSWFVAGPTNWTTQNGSWGLTNSIENTTAPKILGTQQVATTPRTDLTYGVSVPASFDARAVAGATLPYSTTYLKNPGEGKTFDYFVRVPTAGTYQLSFSAAATDSSEQLKFEINNTADQTITLANTGSLTSFANNLVGNFTLEEGMNLIHVTSINEVAGWNMQTVTVSPPGAASATPTVAVAAAASPTTITGKTTNVSVLGADDGAEANLTYSWDALNDQQNSVTFSVNGNNAAKNSIATFSRAGTYTLRCTISDGVMSTISSVVVNVVQTLTSITVAPTGTALANGETRQLTATAKDQFGIQLYTQPTFTWTVDNSFGTVSSTGLYTAPASGLGTAVVRATCGSLSGTATVITQSPQPADNPSFTELGIQYSYYTGTWTTLPNFDALTPISTGVLNNISLSPATATTHFGFQYAGYVYVPQSGTYTFYTNSDDGSKLFVGGQLVVSNDGAHSAQEKSGQIILNVGWHAFKLQYFQGTGSEVLTASYSGPGVTKQTIPDASFEYVDPAPTVATPPAAQPNPVSGTSTVLSVVGADDTGEANLTYTWSTIAAPGGAAQPTFSVNRTNGSKNSTATFFKAGTYTLQAAIFDGIQTTDATLNVTVSATLTSLQLAPQNQTVQQGSSLQFTATGFDQFGNPLATQPQYNWSVDVNGGTITQSGLYTAPATVGTFNVTASLNNVSASTSVTVNPNSAPYVVNAPAANPNPITAGGQTSLSVLGGDDGGEANLSYTWFAQTLPQGAANPTFSANGTNAAKQTVATFTAQGDYTLVVAISDGFTTTSASIVVTVANASNAAPTVVTPATASPSPVTGSTTQLSVLGADDGGEPNLTYTWSLTGNPPAAVNFSSNGVNTSKNTIATFTAAGTYNFLVTISDGAMSTTSATSVTVNQTVTSITMAPTTASVAQNGTKQFTATAFDQFGVALASQPAFNWSLTSTGTPGSITQAGFYTAPSTGTPTDTITASFGSLSASAVVTVTLPSLFPNDADVGSPTLAGSESFNSTTNTYTVVGSGADIFSTSDQFNFAYTNFTGDGQIVARVVSMQNTNTRAKAGVMFRDSLAANSRFVDIVLAPDKTSNIQVRSTTGGNTGGQSVSNTAAPYWVKLVRSGNLFTAYNSPDGVTWTQVGTTATVALNSSLLVGLAVTSHDNTKLNTAVFDNVSVTPAGQLQSAAIVTSAQLSTGAAFGAGTTSSSGSIWLGSDFGSPKLLAQIRFIPVAGMEAKTVGGAFQGSSTADFAHPTNLFVIKSTPKAGVWTTQSISAPAAFRYIRFLAADGSLVDIAGASFMGM